MSSRSESFSFFELTALGSDVWLGVGSWETSCSSEMFLGFTHFAASKEDSLASFIILI